MKLTYRGVNYEANSPELEFTKTEFNAKYRGAALRTSYPRHIAVPQSLVALKYRGVGYCTGEPIDVEAGLLRKRYANTLVKPEATVSSRQQVLNELSNIHLDSVRRTLEHRLEVARAKGDRQLVDLLEAEAKQMSYSN